MKKKKAELISWVVYALCTLLILLGAAWFYVGWFTGFQLSNPQIMEAVAAGYVEEQPLEGILLWDEQLVYAPQDGVFTYPSPLPRRVAKGEMLAALDGMAVLAPYPAYFFPALDGQEGNWFYARLWPEFAPFPFFRSAVLLENGIQFRKGAPIGKLVPQPQVLRCIAYLDSTPSLERNLRAQNATIRIKTEEDGKERKAEVVAVKSAGQKIKVYLRLPFFPPSALRSRAFFARVVAEDRQGVMTPDTAVITKDGRNIVYLLQGNRIFSQDVEGFPAGDHHFFIVKGVIPGNKLIRDAGKVRDSLLRIW